MNFMLRFMVTLFKICIYLVDSTNAIWRQNEIWSLRCNSNKTQRHVFCFEKDYDCNLSKNLFLFWEKLRSSLFKNVLDYSFNKIKKTLYNSTNL